MPNDFYRRHGKRLLDIVASVAGLLLLAPLLAVLFVLVRVRLGKPALFRQVRPGQHAALFAMVKFRTMTDERDSTGRLLPDAARLTPFGARLRATSLDELPELWNVLRGEMSFVGPRPLLPEYLPRYTSDQARRHEVRPGLTGLAQVEMRNSGAWEERFEQDVKYIERMSFRLDVLILARTIGAVLSHRDVTAKGHATMPPFGGNAVATKETVAAPTATESRAA